MMRLIKTKMEDKYFISEVCLETATLYDTILPIFFEKQAEYFIKKGIPQDCRFQIIYEKDERIGFIADKKLESNTIYIMMFYLKSNKYRKGLGSKAIELYEKKVRLENIKKILLFAHKKAYWANNFYLKKGFTLIDELDKINIYKNGILKKYYFENTNLYEKILID